MRLWLPLVLLATSLAAAPAHAGEDAEDDTEWLFVPTTRHVVIDPTAFSRDVRSYVEELLTIGYVHPRVVPNGGGATWRF
jgi:hypothetical protein